MYPRYSIPWPDCNRLHHIFEDPAAVQGSETERLAASRIVLDEIREYVLNFSRVVPGRSARSIVQRAVGQLRDIELFPARLGVGKITDYQRSPLEFERRKKLNLACVHHFDRPGIIAEPLTSGCIEGADSKRVCVVQKVE